jgi:hypothetical protein
LIIEKEQPQAGFTFLGYGRQMAFFAFFIAGISDLIQNRIHEKDCDFYIRG